MVEVGEMTGNLYGVDLAWAEWFGPGTASELKAWMRRRLAFTAGSSGTTGVASGKVKAGIPMAFLVRSGGKPPKRKYVHFRGKRGTEVELGKAVMVSSGRDVLSGGPVYEA